MYDHSIFSTTFLGYEVRFSSKAIYSLQLISSILLVLVHDASHLIFLLSLKLLIMSWISWIIFFISAFDGKKSSQ
jgi:hypothetical protein